jgi:RNA polymerase sigma-70 factor, ECF subfamily
LEKQDTEKQFEKHITENEMLIYKVCRIYAYTDADRQDLFQEIVSALWQAFPRFRGESKFGTWLYRVAINTAVTGLRRQKNFITSFAPATLPVHAIDTDSAKEEQFQQMHTAIEQLSPVEKAIVMLYLEDKPYDEMEDILGISQGNLRVKMSRIKDKLRQLTKNN